ncbi:MAG: PIN domain-containing protein [Phycisphaerales bacterium]|nr:PIN domain-containing protein [Phycisphaerales bacterium]
MLTDTSIFVDYLRGRTQAEVAVATLRASGEVHLHLVVAAELISGARDRAELRRANAVISGCRQIVPTETDLRRALVLLQRHRLADGPDWNDCQIAATAIRLGLPVMTLNEKHFRVFRGLKLVRPYGP